jgi:hypothetical protein
VPRALRRLHAVMSLHDGRALSDRRRRGVLVREQNGEAIQQEVALARLVRRRPSCAARWHPYAQRAGRARVTTVSSSAARFGRLEWDDLQAERRYSPVRAYNASKLANLLFGLELDRRSRTLDERRYIDEATRPSSGSTSRSCLRELMPSLVKILRRCHSTVRGLTNS